MCLQLVNIDDGTLQKVSQDLGELLRASLTSLSPPYTEPAAIDAGLLPEAVEIFDRVRVIDR